MTEIENLRDKIYKDIKPTSPRQFIDFYEENQNQIEATDILESSSNYDEVMRLTSDYAIALSHYGNSKKALTYLDKSIQLFKDSSKDDLTNISMYEMLVWTRGVENYNNKNYNIASKDFQYLVDNYPDNDKYKNWLLASKTIKAKKWMNFFWYGAIVCLAWMTMVNKENAKLKDYLLMAAIALFILAIVTEIMNALLKSSIKQK